MAHITTAVVVGHTTTLVVELQELRPAAAMRRPIMESTVQRLARFQRRPREPSARDAPASGLHTGRHHADPLAICAPSAPACCAPRGAAIAAASERPSCRWPPTRMQVNPSPRQGCMHFPSGDHAPAVIAQGFVLADARRSGQETAHFGTPNYHLPDVNCTMRALVVPRGDTMSRTANVGCADRHPIVGAPSADCNGCRACRYCGNGGGWLQRRSGVTR